MMKAERRLSLRWPSTNRSRFFNRLSIKSGNSRFSISMIHFQWLNTSYLIGYESELSILYQHCDENGRPSCEPGLLLKPAIFADSHSHLITLADFISCSPEASANLFSRMVWMRERLGELKRKAGGGWVVEINDDVAQYAEDSMVGIRRCKVEG